LRVQLSASNVEGSIGTQVISGWTLTEGEESSASFRNTNDRYGDIQEKISPVLSPASRLQGNIRRAVLSQSAHPMAVGASKNLDIIKD